MDLIQASVGRRRAVALRAYAIAILLPLLLFSCLTAQSPAAPPAESSAQPEAYVSRVLPLVHRYCLDCHSTETHKGSLDLERFGTLAQVRKDVKPWQAMLEMLEAGEMPPRQKLQPTAEERGRLIAWVHSFLDDEARARAGDPGRLPMGRLSNSEYDYTIRDLTGVDLHPTREFPADGAAGEGFTNAAEALTDVSPTLLNKYLLSAKEIASHAVLLPDGFRFSPGKTRRDWSDQSLASLRAFYGQFTTDGRLPLGSYLAATLRQREALLAGRITIDEAAAKEKLNPRYLAILWRTLTDSRRSFPLDSIRARWRQASEKDSAALAADIIAWQAKLWNVVAIGSYRNGSTSRQVANNAMIGPVQTMKLAIKPSPGRSDVVVYLSSREVFPGAKVGQVVWSKPRFEAAGKKELLLRDYANYGRSYEVNYAAVFADTARYLEAVAETANDPKTSAEAIAQRDRLDLPLLTRWIDVTALEPRDKKRDDTEVVLRTVPVAILQPLSEQVPATADRPAISGWRTKGSDLPVVLANSSDVEEHIPGRASPHKVVVHPTPTEFVAAAWKSPMDGRVRITANIAHVHPNCGNGVAWWLEHRRADRAGVLDEGAIELGGEARMPPKNITVARGDLLILAVDAKNGDHSCDLTQIDLTITDVDQPGQTWDLAGDVSGNVLEGNPHADKLSNKAVWSFVKGPCRPIEKGVAPGAIIPADSALGRWREAATDPARQAEASKLAQEVQVFLAGAPPTDDKSSNRKLYDSLVSTDSSLLRGIDLSTIGKQNIPASRYGLDTNRFGSRQTDAHIDDASILAPANSAIEIRLPAALFRERAFVVDGKLDSPDADGATRFAILTKPPASDGRADDMASIVASSGSAVYNQLVQGLEDFRQCFPQFICFPGVIPVDEVVCLKMYHREDEPLIRLFLDDNRRQQIDRLWEEHRFITQQPIAENKYLPLFIGFVTQDQPKELVAYFEGQRPAFQKRADDFERDIESAAPSQLAMLADFAARAYRRPLRDNERANLTSLYQTLRNKGASQEDAFRGVLARVLVSPSFLMRIEQAPPGKEAAPVNDWELATRLSYFLWSSVPDNELRSLAAARRLRDPVVLAQQTQRMLKDDRVRALAIEFGTQWIHVRNFDTFNEKSERLYPEFDQNLRSAMYEESILFFQDLFQVDQPVHHILDADYTYLNETLARHYGIPNVAGPQWRKVEGVQKFGRGGILALASVQAKQAGAARTSPVLRGNWVVETLLGEKLPRPPPDVPRLPEEEGGDGLTMRQLVEKHTRVESCAVCHQRIDPFGFSFERYNSIGRLRDKESTGLPIDSRAKLRDGTEFEGLDGLRNYLLTKKKDVIVRLFCRRLLGYAMGRAVALSDQTLIDEMVSAMNREDGRVSAAVLTIVRSRQFRSIRESAFADDE